MLYHIIMKIYGYFSADPYPSSSSDYMWFVGVDGSVGDGEYYSQKLCVRPVVKLPSTITGTVGETIEIK